jgi:hypothetical protein
MATFYSDHFSSDGDNVTTLDANRRAPTGINHGRMRVSSCYLNVETASATNGDDARLIAFKSSDRIHRMFVSADGVPTAGTMDIGLAAAGSSHDGADVDDALFAEALDLSSAIDQVDEYDEHDLDNFDRGKPLWELAGLSADPVVDYDLIATFDTKPDDDTEIRVEVWYTAGD